MKIEEKHSIGLIPIAFSKLFERMAYYGVRAILFLYMMKGPLGTTFSMGETSSLYAVYLGIAGLMPLLGGLLGDLVLGSRRTSIIGLSIQAGSCFLMAIPSVPFFFTGACLLALGSGLYSPNVLSMLSFTYQKRTKLMDSAMLFFYSAINIGAFLGPLIIVFISDKLNYFFAFTFAGFIMMIPLLLLIFTKNLLPEVPETTNIRLSEQSNTTIMKLEWRIISIIFVVFVVALYWTMMMIGDNTVQTIVYRMREELHMADFANLKNMLNPVFTLIFAAVLGILWSFVPLASLLKMIIGFVLLALTWFFMAHTISTDINDHMTLPILLATVLQAIAELFIAPLVISFICQQGTVKFNATMIAVSLSAMYMLFNIPTLLARYADQFPYVQVGTVLGIVSLVIAGILFVLFITGRVQITNRNETTKPGATNNEFSE